MHLPHIQPFEENALFFFTTCIEERRKVLACQQALDELTGIWSRSAERDGWYVGSFVLMPDHVHFFAMPVRGASMRSEWHKMWKSVSARTLCRMLKLSPPLWQPDTFDHILRHKKSYAEKWHYVRENPVRQGLVSDSSEWPWQGEINALQIS
jgi:putative transposase